MSNDQPTIGMDAALERNRAFAAAGGHEGAVVFPNLRLFVITCLDPRVDPAYFLGLGLSDALVVRNVGGRVTPEVINDVAFIGQLAETVLPDGPLFEVAVIHHTQCGTGALADEQFRRRYADRIGAEESALREHAVLDPAATVTRDVERLRSARRDLAAHHRVRARLRRGYRLGGDGHPRASGQLKRPRADASSNLRCVARDGSFLAGQLLEFELDAKRPDHLAGRRDHT